LAKKSALERRGKGGNSLVIAGWIVNMKEEQRGKAAFIAGGMARQAGREKERRSGGSRRLLRG
jgi:hypothetical protein